MPSDALSAWLFPGQGSQKVGMGRELAEHEPAARDLWRRADGALGFPLSRLAWDGPEDELQRTENAQSALLATSIAALRVLSARSALEPPAYLAGHSLGEYSALVAAESLGFEEAVRLVRRRGELMAEAGARTNGAMAAVIGLAVDAVARVCAAEGVDVANYNSPEQTVISGEAGAVERAGDLLREAGARRVVPLPVSGAFHSRLMLSAAEEFSAAVAAAAIRAPRVPVVGNVRAEPLRTEDDVRAELVAQLSSPVAWVRTLEFLRDEGVTRFVEVGPGAVLAGLVKRTLPGAAVTGSDALLMAAGRA